MVRDWLFMLAFFPLWGLCGVALLKLGSLVEPWVRVPVDAVGVGGAVLAVLLLFALERLLGF